MDNLLLNLIRRLVLIIGLVFLFVTILFSYSILSRSDESRIEIGTFSMAMNDNYYSGLVTVIVSIVAIALPLSISVITQSKEDQFNSKEMADSFYRDKRYISLKRSILILAVLMILSYFKEVSIWLVIPTSLATILVIIEFYKYMGIVEEYVSDFAGMIISQEKRNINEIF